MEWTWREIYLADLVDSLHTWLWMNSKDSKNKSKRPKTVVPEYISKSVKKGKSQANKQATGQVSMGIDDIKALLAKERK